MPSAGDRRGRLGMAGRSNLSREKLAASWTERWGRLPMPVVAPGRNCVPSAGGRCRGRSVGVATTGMAPPLPASLPWTVSACLAARPLRSPTPSPGWHREVCPILAPSPQRHRVAVLTSLTVWGARVAWLAAAVFGGRAVGAALADRSTAVQVVGTVGAWVGWAVGAIALAVPSVSTLTVARGSRPGGARRDHCDGCLRCRRG